MTQKKNFTVNNPSYLSESTLLQDIHYDINHGLFFITYRKMKKFPEFIELILIKLLMHLQKNALVPDEVFISSSSISEIESVCIASSGIMYIVQNKGDGKSDLVSKVSGLTFSN
ncbi:hypothetical protein DWX80_18050 [Ruminococcus sp. AF21-3]|nr:hypothetical protein DWX80_18050 [Ruminococcus sp. AF21-3]